MNISALEKMHDDYLIAKTQFIFYNIFTKIETKIQMKYNTFCVIKEKHNSTTQCQKNSSFYTFFNKFS